MVNSAVKFRYMIKKKNHPGARASYPAVNKLDVKNVQFVIDY
jgi:hypothetical protein